MVLMMYFQTSGRFTEQALGTAAATASAIYGVCAYMVLIASQLAMNTELRTLWLLLSLPRPLADSLRVKSRIWGLAAAGLATVLAIAAAIVRPEMAGEIFKRLPFLAVFVALIADLSVGIRTIGSSIISETTVHFRQWANWLPLLLSAFAGHAVFDGDIWDMSVPLVLLGALDVSVWQKLRADLPYLTEPAEDPPPRLFLMHGMLALCGYAALQSAGVFIGIKAKAPDWIILPAASGIAALLVATLTLWQLHRHRVPLFPPRRSGVLLSLPLAAAGLALSILAGWGWLQYLSSSPSFADQLAENQIMMSQATVWEMFGLFLLAVIIAPVCEEFLFRGLVYQGLRQTNGIRWSVLWTSLFFTAVHPMESSVAVFAFAVMNALIMERTGRLLPCIIVHAGYNGFMLWYQAYGR